MKKIGVCVFEETKLESSVWLPRHGEQPKTAGAVGEGDEEGWAAEGSATRSPGNITSFSNRFLL